jgi:outer membrane protein
MRARITCITLCISVSWFIPPLAQAQAAIDPTPSGEKPIPFVDLAKASVGTTGLVVPGEKSVSESPVTLTLAEAEARALKNQPRLLSQRLRTQATDTQVNLYHAALLPQIYGNLSAVEANGDTAVGAGAVTTSSISTRAAGGVSLVQLITDFGRTANLVNAARSQAKVSGQESEIVRQQILRDVDEAYFATQAAESVQKTALAVLDFRRTSLRQLNALAQSQMKSTLDVQFAQVLVSEAELALAQADSNTQKAEAQLAETLGDNGDVSYYLPDYVLADEPLPSEPDSNPSNYIHDALQNRPDIKAMQLQSESAHRYAKAEKDLSYPTISAIGTAGAIPVHDSTLHQNYGAIGVNLNIPIFNGGLYSTRSAVAKLQARAADQDTSLEALRITRDVRMAWSDARNAYLQIQVAQRLVDENNVAMRLAQARYNAGLGSIVELNQAELNQTSALITAASARFDYMRLMTAFNYTLGNMH